MSLMGPVLRANLRSSGKKLWAAGAAITISVAFIITGLLMVDSFTRGISEDVQAEAAGADLIINAEHLSIWDDGEDPQDPVHQDTVLAQLIQDLDSVEVAEPVRASWFEVWDNTEDFRFSVDVRTVGTTQDVELAAGRLPRDETELVINSAAAETEELQVGDTLSAADISWDEETGQSQPAGSVDYTVVGIAEDDLPSPHGLMSAAGLDRLPGTAMVENIRVALRGDLHENAAAQEDAQAEIAALIERSIDSGALTLPEGVSDWAPEDGANAYGVITVASVQVATNQQIVDQWIGQRTGDANILRNIAFGFGGIAVFVSALVITNTFQVLVASRLRTMALLRAIGADAAQLRRATLAEGALLGILGGAAGVLAGWVLALAFMFVLRLLNDGKSLPAVVPNFTAIAVGLGLGLIMAVLSSLAPALKAGRVSPMEALRPADVSSSGRISRPRIIIGSALVAVGLAAALFAALFTPESTDVSAAVNVDPWFGLPMPVYGVAGGALSFLGVLLLGRLVIPPLVSLLGKLLARFSALRVTAPLAGQNARQVPGRTTATASALLVGVTLVVTMTVGAATAQRMLYDELAESHPVDGYITATGADIEETLARLPQVQDAAMLEGVQAMLRGDSGETPVQVLVLNSDQLEEVAYRDVALEPGQVLVPGSFVWGEEQLFSMAEEGQQQTARLTPDGTADSGAQDAALELEVQFGSWVPAGMVVIAEESLAAEAIPGPWQPTERYGATFLRMGEGSGQTEINGVFEAFSENSDQLSLESAYARAGYGEIIDMVLLMVLVLLAAAIIVAVIGVSNTLSLSVFERQREAALLRAVGMNRRAVGSMISLEALLMAAVALLLGTVLGGFFGWAGVSSLVAREDWSVVLEIPWVRVAAIWAATLVAALLAAWLPARQMSRVQPASRLSQQ